DVFFFFFSSRRRHTRCLSDWSSDVCSSDLATRVAAQQVGDAAGRIGTADHADRKDMHGVVLRQAVQLLLEVLAVWAQRIREDKRSEERRVGKECRSRGAPVP